ncbi:MAG: ArsR family transcriptional regulator [Betaproteobacteria bacterium RIFCSPLOWO2_02_FULL_62_17]|nr:MAG: ArsR family transcriptional regulator [Betaproteobacteria bacterium RIFCSPLOWO2_02_FULL_62_17]
MTRVRARGEDIRRFILQEVEKHPLDISKITAKKYGISRQAVNKHLQRLTQEMSLTETGKTRGRTYKLCPLQEWRQSYEIVPGIAEDVIWTNDIREVLGQLPDNVLNIWQYGFTEMFNNAIDHSGGSAIFVHVRKTAVDTEMILHDNGVGIFKKIQTALGLLDERHAILELQKGKLTTDPKRHSGEGIFFTSRMFNSFDILAGGVYFRHEFGKAEDWIMEREKFSEGTTVWMKLHNHTARTSKRIFDQFTSGEDYGFNKTIVPVRLAKYGNDLLISRSQAKRLLERIELFKTVLFDFTGVDAIGQAFADEIFRVFAQQHLNMDLHAIHANSQVKRMIERAKSGGSAMLGGNLQSRTHE